MNVPTEPSNRVHRSEGEALVRRRTSRRMERDSVTRRTDRRWAQPRRILQLIACWTLASVGSLGAAESDAATNAARWTIRPAGEQVFDLLTGETSLPTGGSIVDAVTGLVLQAETISFLEGVSIAAEGVRAEVLGGAVEAARLDIDVLAGTTRASGGLTFTTTGLALEAAAALFLLDLDLARFDAPKGVTPTLEGDRLFLDVRSGDAVLTGPYRFVQGIVAFRDERDDARLMLKTVARADGSVAYQVASEVEEATWERMAPLR